ncbi:type I-E CRISPR-associated protein Cas5/CasD [Streptacidiphilus sp. N1-10]|uniref:Type I-E CRISPR-associated protein Cas5/CasD n=1 Tax=Streptacidiphilus jeojiensis TaxID=3229225 RepID=A0ABV6XXY4_9ACTN
MSGGLLLHLSGPWQSWGGEADFTVRTTHRFPTRSGLTGMIAAALGRPRDSDNTDLTQLRYTIRVDRPGQREADFHTVGGGYPPHLTPATADGKRRPEGKGTIISERWYLADAAFTLAVTGPTATLTLAAEGLARPVYAPYLGRRSCPPDTPILIRAHVPDPVGELDRMPLHRPTAPNKAPQPVTFIYDQAPEPGAHPDAEIRDEAGPNGTCAPRPLWQRTRLLPHAPDTPGGTAWIDALTAYRKEAST